jgi:hypothetical protein
LLQRLSRKISIYWGRGWYRLCCWTDEITVRQPSPSCLMPALAVPSLKRFPWIISNLCLIWIHKICRIEDTQYKVNREHM